MVTMMMMVIRIVGRTADVDVHDEDRGCLTVEGEKIIDKTKEEANIDYNLFRIQPELIWVTNNVTKIEKREN